MTSDYALIWHTERLLRLFNRWQANGAPKATFPEFVALAAACGDESAIAVRTLRGLL